MLDGTALSHLRREGEAEGMAEQWKCSPGLLKAEFMYAAVAAIGRGRQEGEGNIKVHERRKLSGNTGSVRSLTLRAKMGTSIAIWDVIWICDCHSFASTTI